MTERHIDHAQNDDVKSPLKAILSPWENLPPTDIVSLVPSLAIPLLELSRRSGFSTAAVLDHLPTFIELGDQPFRVLRASRIANDEDKQTRNIGIKKLIRGSVQEPPIRGVRNGKRRLNEKVLATHVAQAKIERDCLIFRPAEIPDRAVIRQRRRDSINQRRGERCLAKFGQGKQRVEFGHQSRFSPEDISRRKDGELFNPNMVSFLARFDKVRQLINPRALFPDTKGRSVEDILRASSQKAPDPVLLRQIDTITQTTRQISFGIMCLPCLNPNPFVTDQPSTAINIPTVLFLERLEFFAQLLENATGCTVKFNLARELEHMANIFTFSNEQIRLGISGLYDLLRARGLTHINICAFPAATQASSIPTAQEIKKFFPAFKRSQRDDSIDPLAQMAWLGVINKNDTAKTARKKGLDLNSELRKTSALDRLAWIQAKKWARLRQSPWQETEGICGSIIISIRPGSRNFTIIPITTNSSDKLPMLPQHCSVGIDPNSDLLTMKRIDFLLHPDKWVEIITEFGVIFISTTLV